MIATQLAAGPGIGFRTVAVAPSRLDGLAPALAAGLFLVVLCVLYLGADHPPPTGFLWLVPLDLVAALWSIDGPRPMPRGMQSAGPAGFRGCCATAP